MQLQRGVEPWVNIWKFTSTASEWLPWTLFTHFPWKLLQCKWEFSAPVWTKQISDDDNGVDFNDLQWINSSMADDYSWHPLTLVALARVSEMFFMPIKYSQSDEICWMRNHLNREKKSVKCRRRTRVDFYGIVGEELSQNFINSLGLWWSRRVFWLLLATQSDIKAMRTRVLWSRDSLSLMQVHFSEVLWC